MADKYSIVLVYELIEGTGNTHHTARTLYTCHNHACMHHAYQCMILSPISSPVKRASNLARKFSGADGRHHSTVVRCMKTP